MWGEARNFNQVIRNINFINFQRKFMLNQQDKLVVASYPYRGTANIPRMVCEYLKMPYENLLFNPCTWKNYKDEFTASWDFVQLPFLTDGRLVVTQSYPMTEYVARKSGRLEMLGRNAQDMLVVDGFLWGKDLIQSLLSVVVENKNNPKKLMQEMHGKWYKIIRSQLIEYQKCAKSGGAYLGYVTVVDFIIYELIEHYKGIFREQISLFPKLTHIWQRVFDLPEIKAFLGSDRCVREICPLKVYRQWKTEVFRSSEPFENCSSTSSKGSMECSMNDV